MPAVRGFASGRDLEVLDVHGDPDVPEHGGHRLDDLELLGIEVLHQHEVEREVLVARFLEDLARLLGVVGLLAEVRVADEAGGDGAVHRARISEQEVLDDDVPVDGERDGPANAGILDRLLGELEDPPLRLDGRRVEDPDAGVERSVCTLSGHTRSMTWISPARSAATRVDSSGMNRNVTFSTLGIPGFQ